jgi:hypothetical protein
MDKYGMGLATDRAKIKRKTSMMVGGRSATGTCMTLPNM